MSETGGMRRLYLRGRENILKRVLIHLGAFNLALVMRGQLGKGTPRGLQGLSAESLLMWLRVWMAVLVRIASEYAPLHMLMLLAEKTSFPAWQSEQPTSATDC